MFQLCNLQCPALIELDGYLLKQFNSSDASMQSLTPSHLPTNNKDLLIFDREKAIRCKIKKKIKVKFDCDKHFFNDLNCIS